MKRTAPFAALMFALALGQVAHAATGAGTQITNTATASYPDPDGGATPLTATSNEVVVTTLPVPSLAIFQNGGDVAGGTAVPIVIGAGYTGAVAPSQKVAVLYTLTNTSNVDDRYALSDDVNNTSGVSVKYYPYSALPAAPTQAQINALSSGNVTDLGSEADNTKAITHTTGNTSRFWVVYTVPASGTVQIGPVGTSDISSSATTVTFQTDPDGAGPLPAATVNGTNTPVFDGKKDATGTGLQGSQNLHKLDVASSTISGKVFNDLSNSAVGNATEPGLQGVSVTLQQKQTDGSFTPFTPSGATGPTTTTDSSGNYSFANLPAGTYRVVETQPTPYVQGKLYQAGAEVTTPVDIDTLEVTLAASGSSSNNDFGERGTVVSGKVYNDANDDGSFNTGDSGIGSVIITLQRETATPGTFADFNLPGTSSPTTTTSSSGDYTIAGLPSGIYRIKEAQPSGYDNGQENPTNQKDLTFTIVSGAFSPNGATVNFGEKAQAPDTVDKTYPTALSQTAGATPLSSTPLEGTDPQGVGNIESFVIKSLPNFGTLTLNGNPVTVGQEIPFADRDKLVYTPAVGSSANVVFQYATKNKQGVEDPTPATYKIPVTVPSTVCTNTGNLFSSSGNFGVVPSGTTISPFPPTGPNRYQLSSSTGTTLPAISGPNGTSQYTVNARVYSNPTSKFSPEDGEYELTNSTSDRTDGAWHVIYDHTSGDGSGLMMVVNANDNPSQVPNVFYQEQVSVSANKTYNVSFWIINLIKNPGNLEPDVSLEVERRSGTTILSTQVVASSGPIASSSNPKWINFTAPINSGAADNIIFRFKNNAAGGGGNDLALDDLYLASCDTPSGTVTGTLFTDPNANGIIDTGETPKGKDITVQLIGKDSNGNDVVIATTVTDASGKYTFSGIPVGTYTVKVDTTDPDLTGGNTPTLPTGASSPVTVPSSGTATQNFGFKGQSADLELLKTVVSKTAKAGDTVTFTLTVTNKGPDAVNGATLSDTLPVGFSDPVITGGTGGSFAANVLSWNVPNLAAPTTATPPVNDSKTLTFTAKVVDPAALVAGNYKNTATVTLPSGLTDPTPANNTSSAELGALILNKSVRNFTVNPTGAFATTASGKPGEVLEYCIDAKNLNSRALLNVGVSDLVPANTTYSAFSTGSTGTTVGTPVTKVNFTDIASLASDATKTQCFKVTIN